MNIITKSVLVASCAALLVSVQANAQGVNKPVRSISDTSLDCYFAPCSGEFATPDAEGFIRRWSLLEPIDKKEPMTDEQKNAAGFRRGNVFPNTLFTDSYLRDHFGREYFKDQMTIVPKDGQKVKVGKKKLAWHCFDSELYNIKLFRLASNLKTDVYGVLFWAVTVVNCDEDIENVRLSAGSNSSSMWWLNGEEVLLLSGDRRMVQDDAASKRLTLKKGKNVLRGAIINGPGMSDFCIRFVDENGQPVKNITISNQ